MAHEFKEGQKVTFTKHRFIGDRIRISSVDAKIESIEGDVACIKLKNGIKRTMHLSHLTPADQPNALTRAFAGSMRGSDVESTD